MRLASVKMWWAWTGRRNSDPVGYSRFLIACLTTPSSPPRSDAAKSANTCSSVARASALAGESSASRAASWSKTCCSSECRTTPGSDPLESRGLRIMPALSGTNTWRPRVTGFPSHTRGEGTTAPKDSLCVFETLRESAFLGHRHAFLGQLGHNRRIRRGRRGRSKPGRA